MNIEEIMSMIVSEEYHEVGKTTTICVMTTKDGNEIIGTSCSRGEDGQQNSRTDALGHLVVIAHRDRQKTRTVMIHIAKDLPILTSIWDDAGEEAEWVRDEDCLSSGEYDMLFKDEHTVCLTEDHEVSYTIDLVDFKRFVKTRDIEVHI